MNLREYIKYTIWQVRRYLSRLFYKKWRIRIDFSDGSGYLSQEIDPELETIKLDK